MSEVQTLPENFESEKLLKTENVLDNLNKTFYENYKSQNGKYSVFLKDPFEWGKGSTNIYTGLLVPLDPEDMQRVPAKVNPPVFAENVGLVIKNVFQNTLKKTDYIEYLKSGGEYNKVKDIIINITNKSISIFYESLVKFLFGDKVDNDYSSKITKYTTMLNSLKQSMETNKVENLSFVNGLDLRAQIDMLSFQMEQGYKENSNDKTIIANSTKSNQVLIISKKAMLEIRASQTNDYQNWNVLDGFGGVIVIDSDNYELWIVDKNALGIRTKFNFQGEQEFNSTLEVDIYNHIWIEFAFLKKMVCRKFVFTKSQV